MILNTLETAGVIHPPRWLVANTAYLTIMGSQAYGVSTDSSDMDVYGFTIPPKDVLFPHLAGILPGFGDQGERFEQWSEHHIKHPSAPDKEYDFAVYSIVKYFQLCAENNPNMIDSLFTHRTCVLHSTRLAEMMRERRKEFLHRGAWFKFKGYAYSQMAKIKSKVNATNEKRAAQIAEFGYDLKFAYHTVRLLNEIEQIIVEGDLDLQRNREQLKSIRRGDWTLPELEEYVTMKERSLEAMYAASTLPNVPDWGNLKELLLNCLEQHYGNLSTAVSRLPNMDRMVRELEAVISRYR